MIKFEKVSKSYPNGFHALQNINLNIAEGEMVLLTGHSGAGKTTLLKLIMMIERISSGALFFQNKNINKIRRNKIAAIRQEIGMVFQNAKLLTDRTVYENVASPLVINGYKPAEIKKRVRAALDKVGLSNKENMLPIALSMGEQQRVGLARAVINKPKLILADEPTGNLDPQLSAEMFQLLKEFNNVGVTVLIATHDLPLIATMPYRILTLRQGNLIGTQNAVNLITETA
ncbi:MAG: cell division ATP-binding protein FtsE [Gammaproteobacteria bacterium RIFCSPHIGHO2_12_FULL_41_15]|nr:MAG: cell division ATP-binding protein FtsE [Gammaproteobacteria bacterium RIFCSPHIGHO2_12_FULL_41_15]